jgi:hypothetical protein
VQYDANVMTERELLNAIREAGKAQGESYKPKVVDDPVKA